MARACTVARSLNAASESGTLTEVAEALAQRMRIQLADLLTVDRVPGARIVLTPSGTDAEMIATWLAARDCKRPLCNIVVAPAEVGSGTVLAAGVRHFNSHTPHGGEVLAGDPVAQDLTSLVRLETIAVRGRDGALVSADEFDATTVETVRAAIARGERVLLHHVAHSKTGAHVPSADAVRRLVAEYGHDQISVVVDAAQGRLSRSRLREALSAGYIVLFTGSKFFGGPPFSGGLLLPPERHPDAMGAKSMPVGLGDYFTASELPVEWSRARKDLDDAPNVGLLVRWAAALSEMEAYYDLPVETRHDVLSGFEAVVSEVLGASPYLTLATVDPVLDTDQREHPLESRRTVFPFYVHASHEGPETSLSAKRLSRIHDWCNRAVADLVPGIDGHALDERFHLGQPVTVSAALGRAVLRIAIGAPLVVRLATDTEIGDTLVERLAWMRERLLCLRRKLEQLSEHYATAAGAEEEAA